MSVLRPVIWTAVTAALLLAALLVPQAPGPLELVHRMQGSFDYELRYLGRPAGHYRSETRLAGDRIIFSTRLETELADQGMRHVEERLEFAATPPFALLRATRKQRNEARRQRTELQARDGGYAARIERGGQSMRQHLDWRYTLADHLALELELARSAPARGGSVSVPYLDLERLAPVRRRWEMIDHTADGGYLLRAAASREDGLLHLDERLVPRGITMTELLTLTRSDEPAVSGTLAVTSTARSGEEVAAPELISAAHAFVALQEPIREPRRVTRATLRLPAEAARSLRGIAGLDWPDDDQGETGRLLRLEEQPARSAEPGEALAARAAGAALPSHHGRIAALVTEALEPGLTPQEQAAALTRFVHGYLRYSDDSRPLDLLDAVSERRGSCSEFANLFTAMARAAGLPARTVTGLVYGEERGPGLYLHAWNEVLLDDAWHALDPTLGMTRTSALHIPFPATHGGYLRSYAAFAGASVEIESLSRDSP